MSKTVTVNMIKSYIRKCLRRGITSISFLGFVENKDLSPQVIALFKVGTMYNWVSGNDRMQDLIKKVKQEPAILKCPCPACGAERESNLINCSVCGWEG